MKIVTIVGARPQFIKAAPVSRAIKKHNREGHGTQITEILVHTGQHYDDAMSGIFFRDLDLPEPHVNLDVGSGPHGWQTAQMLMRIEEVLMAQKPDMVLVYGDTNSTLAGALAAVKLHIPLAHVEAGLRSFNRDMPEEHNRVISDHLSDLLFCPTQTAVKNLEREGFTNINDAPHSSHLTPHIYLVGDTMYDAVLQFSEIAQRHSTILDNLGIESKEYLLATVHRAENTDDHDRLGNIMAALSELAEREVVVLPLHPRTIKILDAPHSSLFPPHPSLKMIPPVGYLDMLILEPVSYTHLTLPTTPYV